MHNLNLPKPRLIDVSVPANRYCGLEEHERQDAVAHRDAQRAQSSSPASCDVPSTNKGKVMTGQELVMAAKQQITEVNVDFVRHLIAEGNIRIIDVREESEYSAGHLENAIALPRGVLEFKIGNVPELADRTQAILLYCRTGGRSALATQTLQTLGYTHVLSMAGGYEAWQKSA
jgi:rhodanese-related sulfurtransferase